MIETIFGGLLVVGIAGLFRAAYLHPKSYRRLNERASLVLGVISAIVAAYGIGYAQDRNIQWSDPNLAYPLWIFVSCAALQFIGAVAPFFTSGLREEKTESEEEDQ